MQDNWPSLFNKPVLWKQAQSRSYGTEAGANVAPEEIQIWIKSNKACFGDKWIM